MKSTFLFVLSLFFLFISVHYNGYAQENNIVISGKILDEKTKAPIPYANIGVMNTYLGTISNEGGHFYLSIPVKYAANMLFFSFVGYKPQQILISEIIKEKHITILLSERIHEIDEVVVRGSKLTAEKIMNRAVRKFNKNYSTTRFELTAFFRHHAFHPWNDDPYLNLSDFEVKIQDNGMRTNPDSSVNMQLLKMRNGANYLNNKFVLDSLVVSNLMMIFTGQGNYNDLYDTYSEDIVRFTNGSSWFSSSLFRDDGYLKQELILDGIVNMDSLLCYKISIKPYHTTLSIKGDKMKKKNQVISYEAFKDQFKFPENTPKVAIDSMYSRFVRKANNTGSGTMVDSTIKEVIYINTIDFAVLGYERENIFANGYYSKFIRYQKIGKKYYLSVINSIKPERARERHDSSEKYINPYSVSTLVITDVKTKGIKSIHKDQRFYSWSVLEKVQLPYIPNEWDTQIQIPYDDTIYEMIPKKLGNKSLKHNKLPIQ